MLNTKMSSNKNLTVSYNGAVNSYVDDFALLGMATTGTAWLAMFVFALLSTGCTPTPGTSGVERVTVVEASASNVVAAPASKATAEAPETTSGNVVDMTF